MKRFLILISILSGCYYKKVEYKDGKNVFIFAVFENWRQQVQIFSEPLFDVDEVEAYVNDNKMYGSWSWLGWIILHSVYYLSPGELHRLKVDFPGGSANGEVRIPFYLYITFPPDDTILPLNEAKIVWKKTQDADWYSSHFYFWFYDSLYYYIGRERKFISTKDTFIEIKPVIEEWFIDSGAVYAEVEAYLVPVSGPFPSELGNIKGDARGYLLGYGVEDLVNFYIYIGKRPLKKIERKFVLKDKDRKYIKENLIERIKEEFLKYF